MLKEFKDFVMRGNVLDLAIAVIIGGAFGKIVASLVNDMIMPVIGIVIGGVNFTDLAYKYSDTAIIRWGVFVQTIVDFLLVAFVIFMIVKLANSMKKAPTITPDGPTTKDCPYCLSVIHIKATRCAHCSQVVD